MKSRQTKHRRSERLHIGLVLTAGKAVITFVKDHCHKRIVSYNKSPLKDDPNYQVAERSLPEYDSNL